MVMETGHDPAYCSLAYCQRCDDYGDGYSRGKDKAIWEEELRSLCIASDARSRTLQEVQVMLQSYARHFDQDAVLQWFNAEFGG